MLYRNLLPLVALACVACAAQNTRPPPEEPVSTTRTTSAALTTTPASTRARITTRAAMPTADPAFVKAPLEPKYRAVLERNPKLVGISLDTVRIEQVGGHVVLRGYLPTVADKVEVELSIRQLKDVTSVSNDIRPLR